MAKVINCQCGATLRGETDDELIAASDSHVQTEHPNLVGKLSREQILAMATDDAPPAPPAEPAAQS